MPDCWIPIGECGVVVWLELKIGTIKGEILSYDIRPEQRKEMRRMISDACAVGVLVGVKGTADIIAFFPSPEVLGGRVNFPRALAEGHGFAFEGLNPETLKSCCRFIFFKSCEIWPSLDRV